MDYNKVCELEEMELYRRFLPYCKGAPSEKLSFDLQSDRANFVFFTDSHIDHIDTAESLDNVKRTIDFINGAPITYDAVIHGGDAITPFGLHEKEASLDRARLFFEEAKRCNRPFIFSKGNHDLNDWDNLPERVFTDDDWGRLILDYEEEKHGIVRQMKNCGSRSTWHYYDVEDKKIRIVSIDVQDTDKTSVREDGTVKYYGCGNFYVSNEQMNWVAHTALNFENKTEKDWGVIFVMHTFGGAKRDDEDYSGLLDLCAAFNNGERFDLERSHSDNPFFDLSVHADFSNNCENPPHMICWLIGHNHTDTNECRKGINLIWTLNGSATCVSGDSRVARVKGTSTQNAFDILNVDTTHRRIRIFRYGAGVTCFGVGGDRFLPDGIEY